MQRLFLEVGMTDIEALKLRGVKVAVVDDHEVVLEGLHSYMQRNGMKHVSLFVSAHDLLISVKSGTYFDVYIIDVELPDMEIGRLIDLLRNMQPQVKIIINTMHEELWVVRRMMEKEVDGVVYKSDNLEQLLKAIIEVTEGRTYFNPRFKRSQSSIQLRDNVLTKREMDVLNAIAKGLSTKEIAQELFISENTVETHRQNIFAKLKVHNVADLLVKAIRAGYIHPAGQ